MEYKCIANGFKARKLVPVSEPTSKHIEGWDKDWYEGIFFYNDEHKKHFNKENSLAGIKDVTTTKLIWDLDSQNDLGQARDDARDICQRLIEHGVAQDCLRIAFSGSKGFSVEIHTNKRFTPSEFKNVNLTLASGLKTNDQSIYDPQRIFRVTGTKHNKTEYYKTPLTLDQLSEMSINDIKEMAKNINDVEFPDYGVVELPEAINEMRGKEDNKLPTTVDVKSPIELDFRSKPKGLPNCKFALMNGFFEEGDRSNSLMVLCATFKSLFYPKDITYGMLKGAARLQAARTNTDEFPKEQIWNNIVEQIYKPTWNGGSYTCKTQPFLKTICDSLGHNKCFHTDSVFVSTAEMCHQFEDYSLNIEKNTIKTGIADLDNAVQLTVGMPVALLGSPSSGKTSLAITMLNNTSNSNISSAFFSMDMYGPLVYMKKVQKHFGYDSRQVHDIFKTNKKHAQEINDKIREEYKNVKFSLKSGYTVEEMRQTIYDHEQKSGDKIKLVLIDYLECIGGPFSDATANTAKIAGQLRDMATETNTCVITLVQPPKSAGDASAPLTSMRQIKGSSMLEQSFRVVLGIYREGFGPGMTEYDNFLTINALKNTMGPLFQIDQKWIGSRGSIVELDSAGYKDLQLLRQMLETKAKMKQSNWLDV